MANMIIQENGKERLSPAVHGEEITIVAPCDCTAVTGVQIAGVAYPFYDACGNSIADVAGRFAEGSLIRVLIDTAKQRAQIINRTLTGLTGATDPSESTAGVPGQMYWNSAESTLWSCTRRETTPN